MRVAACCLLGLGLIAACGTTDTKDANEGGSTNGSTFSGTSGASGTTGSSGVTGYTGPHFIPSECSAEVDGAILAVTAKYRLPRWFYYSVVHRESTFTPTAYRSDDGGSGLTQLTGLWYNGTPYPESLAAPNQANNSWKWDMNLPGLKVNGQDWIEMNNVTPLQAGEWADPLKNLERYSSGYAAPMFHLQRSLYPSETLDETLRRVAYHWRYGVWDAADRHYPDDPAGYMPGMWGYDAHVVRYKASVEEEDGVFTGDVAAPPY